MILLLLLVTALTLATMSDIGDAYGKEQHGHVKIKVWRGPSVGHKKYKHAPFGYHFSVDEKGH